MRVIVITQNYYSNSKNFNKQKKTQRYNYNNINFNGKIFNNKKLENIAIAGLITTPVTGALGIGTAVAAYIVDKFHNEDDNNQTKK